MEIERKWMVNGWPEGENFPALPLTIHLRSISMVFSSFLCFCIYSSTFLC